MNVADGVIEALSAVCGAFSASCLAHFCRKKSWREKRCLRGDMGCAASPASVTRPSCPSQGVGSQYDTLFIGTLVSFGSHSMADLHGSGKYLPLSLICASRAASSELGSGLPSHWMMMPKSQSSGLPGSGTSWAEVSLADTSSTADRVDRQVNGGITHRRCNM